MKKEILLTLALAGFTIASNAQSTASATSTATIVTPISITKNVDVSFGNIAVGASGGTVILATDGTRSTTGGVTLPTTTGTVTAADFTVTGTDTYTFSITLPTTPVTLTRASGTETMDATAFTSTPSGSGTLSSGTKDVKVGATLTVAASQAAGVYTSGDFDVTVNYE
ncbi:DUF4402 domain-containing protein [Danxiaibacter flavus]|uniref:DUF4402 domain-containing protein n=1 Tax=Danxiaibacter flavus TaxID=3049108 RepID=A0ABV3ZJF0_9BACT|nr:DUF4402 domain-containing protein [Chitinophagaceae bacterium DXS]